MKIAAQVLLIILLVPVFLVGILSTTLKFQLLDVKFWQTTFEKNNVYQNLADVSKASVENQIGVSDGSKNDIKVLTDLITPVNMKDVVDNNLQNFLNFANGISSQLYVYVPIDKIPKNILPKNLNELKSEMTLQSLLTEFNFKDYQNLPMTAVSQLGKNSLYIFALSLSVLLLILVFLYMLTESGKNLIGLGVTFTLCAGLTLLLARIWLSLETTMPVTRTSIAGVFVGTLIPPVASAVFSIWQTLGLILLVLGFVLFFIKKPGYNRQK